MSLYSLASRMAKHITEGTGMGPERVDRVRYGLPVQYNFKERRCDEQCRKLRSYYSLPWF
jgi:hypothetical protein